ncbi:glycerol-3-phosphate responsive antiterminator [Paenibacillus lignilyticus]|uniref:Glycerol uptake operon antiterminator regulatory protein n=1 Tax=Paenibacillus lignilyticus TaxID=1172615 RepID=A0ABS5C983_9BACL|nr:glycerol-3-phosphate responsive antiterminator [Paenibacillus lignilyticus]MBP3962566.1 glycerol-3-phosphate responsive antiterminator [Paenibacillus lignilyticus]
MQLLYKVGKNPIIAAVRKPEDLGDALRSPVDNVFFMGGTVLELVQSVRLTKEAGKGAFVHLDLIKGLSSTDRESLEWIAKYAGADGVISPKSHIIKEAKRFGLYGILHLFVIDTVALENGLKLSRQVDPDGIELMPGVIDKVIRTFSELLSDKLIIASGLIQTREEVNTALNAGATSLSVSNKELWNITFDQLN